MNKQATPISFAREQQLVKLLMTYLATGLLFMVLPGTFLGVWNLFAISSAQSATSVSATWIQAHGHAQLFGWIGSFILGIGFYSIPNLRRVSAWSYWDGWLIWALWTAGVSLRWLANVYLWQWRVTLPLSAVLEFLAVAIFLFRSAQGHRMQRTMKGAIEPWAALVIGGTIGLAASMALNSAEAFSLSLSGASPTFPTEFDSGFLTLSIWGFTVPIAWGFTAHWMPVFLGLRPLSKSSIYFVIALLVSGIVTAFAYTSLTSALMLMAASVLVVIALRIFEPPSKPAKTQGVHKSFPVFMRIAYAWLLIASVLLLWGASDPGSLGIVGAGRHAITVGFLMTMVFTVGPRMLPAFLGRQKLFSERLMFLALLLTNTGCLARVSSEIVAYQYHATWAWLLLPLSATLELTGVLVFTINMIATFRERPLSACKSKVVLPPNADEVVASES